MKKRPPQESEMSVCVTAASIANFTGTDNPRELRAIHALMTRPTTREHLDRATGSSNSPDLIFRMRVKGLEIPCDKVPDTDRDGLPIRRGVFHLTDSDRKKINRWLAARQSGGVDLTLAGWLAFAGVCAFMLSGAM